MSSNVKKYSAVLILLMYLIAEVGVGMHRCNIESTSYIIPTIYSTDCESVHQHESANQSAHKHEGANQSAHKHQDNSSHTGCSSCSSAPSDKTQTEVIDGFFSTPECCNSQFFSLQIDQLNTNVKSDIDLTSIDLNFDYIVNKTSDQFATKYVVIEKEIPLNINLRRSLTLLSNWRL